MDQTSARPSTLRQAAFRDGLGERRRMADASGIEKLEILCIRRDLAAVDSFESSLRDRANQLASFRSPGFARVRTVERLNDAAATLVVASEPVQGVRLSALLTVAERHGLSMDGSAKWCLIKQLVAAVGTLHRHDPNAVHGAIAAERIVITSDAHVILVEHVLGSALQQLRFSPDRYWRDLRVALPKSGTELSQQTDVIQAGVVALSVILGCPMSDEDYPARIAALVEKGWAISAKTDQKPTPASLRSWLARALQLDGKDSFASAVEANNALDKAIVESGFMIAPSDLEAFLALCQEPQDASVAKPASPVAVASTTEPAKAAAPVPTPVPAAKPVKAQEKSEPAKPQPQPSKATPVTAQVSKQTAAPKAAQPKPAAPKPTPTPVPAARFQADTPPTSESREAKGYVGRILSTASSSTWRRKAAAVALLTVVSGAGWAAASRFFDGPEKVAETPAPIESVPTVNMTPSAPELAAISTPIAPLAPPTGQLDVRTDPPGATVTIGGQRRGVTPLTVTDLPPGRHTVLLEGDQGSLTRSVVIDPGQTAALVTDIMSEPPTGFLTVTAPSAVEIFENGRLLGSSQSGRISLPTGQHQLELVNQALGYRITRTVQVASGANTPIALEFPKGTLALNAIPWAEVFVDGQKVGDTPIGNLPVTLGTHEVIFRNPDLGEQRMTATVTLNAPTRLSVDLRKR